MTRLGEIEDSILKKYGGKIYWLDRIIKNGLDVPKGIVLGRCIYKRFLEFNEICHKNSNEEVFKFDQLRKEVYQGSFEKNDIDFLLDLFNSLKKPVIVRSSGNEEDSTLQSCAGLFTTVDQIYTFEKFLEGIKICWLSTYNEVLDVVIGKDRDYGINLLVQEELKASIGGVAFSINPINNNVNEILYEWSSKGPKDVVRGNGNIERKRISKEIDNSNLTKIEKDIKNALLTLVNLMGEEVDLEWLVSDDKFYILQARPITTFEKGEDKKYISIDDKDVLKYSLKNCLEKHARWLEKKDIIRKKCIKNGIKIGKFYYYFLEKDVELLEIEKLLLNFGTPMVEVYYGKEALLVEKERVKEVLFDIKEPVVRLGESIVTEISGFSTIMGDNIYFEGVKGGFAGFYNGDFSPTKYITDLHGNIIFEDIRDFEEEYALLDNKWQKRKIDKYKLEFSREEIKKIIELTKKLSSEFENVRTEWIMDKSEIYLFDVTIEKGQIDNEYKDCNILSRGECIGEIKILEDISIFDEFSDDISIRMGHEFESLMNEDKLVKLKKSLDLEGKIIVCDYPKEQLALLTDQVTGFVFERGSLLCHLGIILREKNIPAVIMKNAKSILEDGVRVEGGNSIFSKA